MSGSYELYAEVLRRTAVKVAKEIGWELEPSRAQFVPDSVAYWPPFRRPTPRWTGWPAATRSGIVSNIDDKLLGISRRHLRTDLDIVVTAQQVRSYKPDEAHFRECARRLGGKKGWVHIASGYDADVAPLLKMKVPVIWVNPPRREARRPQEARLRGQDLPGGGRQARREVGLLMTRPCRRGDGRPRPRALCRGRRRIARGAQPTGGAFRT